MASYKTVKNPQTGSVFYYLDKKRVSAEKYNDTYYMELMQGKEPHSLWVTSDVKTGLVRSGLCMD